MEQIPDDAARWTPRLLLRQPIADDVGVILRLHHDPLAIAHNPGDALEDEVAAQDLLQRWTQHWKQYAIGYWALSWRSDPAVLGFCGVKVMALHGHAVSNLLYRLDPRVWGCGVATETASAVVGEALCHRPDDRRRCLHWANPGTGEPTLFVGDDWAGDHHDIEIVDDDGNMLVRKRLPEGLEGVTRLHSLVAEQMLRTGSTATPAKPRLW